MHPTLKRSTFHPREHSRPSSSRRRGSTLLELLAVVIIMGIMTVIIIPRLGDHTGRAKASVCGQYQGDINDKLEKYYFDKGVWATELNDIQSDEYYPTAIPTCPVSGQAYTIDPATHRLNGHSH